MANEAFAPHRDSEPDRLPDESRQAYRRRTIPGYGDQQREKQRNRRRAENLTEERRVKRNLHTTERKRRNRADGMGTVEHPLPPLAPYGMIRR